PGCTPTLFGPGGPANGEPGAAERPPVDWSMAYTPTLPPPALATNRNLPAGSTAAPCGPVPGVKAKVLDRVNAPVPALIEYAATLGLFTPKAALPLFVT